MEGHTRDLGATAEEFFDKYLLPKAALVVILTASLAGTFLSVRLAGATGIVMVGAKWAYLVVLGILTGGFLWKHAFVRPGDVTGDTAEYSRTMFGRFDRIAVGALGVLVVTGPFVVRHYLTSGVDTSVGILVGGTVASLAVLSLLSVSAGVETGHRSRIGTTATVLAVGAVVVTAIAEVSLSSRGLTAAGVRILHLLAFAVWVGGAVWNIFVAVPSGQVRPTPHVVRAASRQLERFRWAVLAIIPTLLLTGVYQSVDAFGVDPGVYVGTGLGWVVVGKLGLIVVLVGIFLTCPMWRACSPIDGVCDLTDLDTDTDHGDAAGASTDD